MMKIHHNLLFEEVVQRVSFFSHFAQEERAIDEAICGAIDEGLPRKAPVPTSWSHALWTLRSQSMWMSHSSSISNCSLRLTHPIWLFRYNRLHIFCWISFISIVSISSSILFIYLIIPIKAVYMHKT